MIRWSYVSPSPKTATELNVTGSRFFVFSLEHVHLLPDQGELAVPGLDLLFDDVLAPRPAVVGVADGDLRRALPIKAPSAGVPGGAPGEVGSTPLRDWFRNWMRTVTVTPASPLRAMS